MQIKKQIKTFCTERLVGDQVYCDTIQARTLQEAEDLCEWNEEVVGELVETILVGLN